MPDYKAEYDRRRLAALEAVVPAGSGHAADVGCHEGWTTRLLASRGYVPLGVDIDRAAVAAATAAHPDLSFEVGSVDVLAAAAPWDVVLCLEVLEHIEPDEQQPFLDQLRGVVGDGACLILSTPGRYSAMSLYERARGRVRGERSYDWWDPTHVGVVSYRTLRTMLERAGFAVEELTGYYFIPARLRPPFALRGPLGRLGWNLIVRARAVR